MCFSVQSITQMYKKNEKIDICTIFNMQNYIIIVKHMLILISISLCSKFKVLTQNFKIYYISVSNVFLVCKVLYKCIYMHIFTI